MRKVRAKGRKRVIDLVLSSNSFVKAIFYSLIALFIAGVAFALQYWLAFHDLRMTYFSLMQSIFALVLMDMLTTYALREA